jgi:transposase
VIETLEHLGARVRITARARAESGTCLRCGTRSATVHGRYRRRLVDAAVGGHPLIVDLLVRRWRCRNTDCATVTFAEQIPGLTSPHSRYTPLATETIEAIGLALAGRAGARLAARLGMAAGRDTLLRRVRALADPVVTLVPTLGVDDFALRKSHDYGTVLVDMDSHRPVDLLPGRAAEPFAAWLTAHPGVGVICRDRAGAYALGASAGAPDAIQVADRYHLWANLGEAVSKTVTAHRTALRDAPCDPLGLATAADERAGSDRDDGDGTVPAQAPVTSVPTVVTVLPDKAIVVRTRERYAEVHALLAAGGSRNQVARTLGLDIQTVRRFANATTVEEVLAATLERESKIDAFKEHLHRRWNEGITSAAALTGEICAQGYTGSVQTVRRYLRRFRGGQPAPTPGATPPTVRQTSRWLMTRPDRLDPADRDTLQAILDRSPDLARLADHVNDFAVMMTQLQGPRLPEWIAGVEADTLTPLASFARHLRNDLAAVINGLTLAYSSGAVEGTVNKIKTLKRQMYGRANFDLLRKRILLA